MADEHSSHPVLFDSNIEDVSVLVVLKVQGLAPENLQSICQFFPVELKSENKASKWEIHAKTRDFGTHKIQTVQLFAVALLIHTHFPQTRMALMGALELEVSSPLTISEAGQIFLQQAGFEIKYPMINRTLGEAEMLDLKEQLLQLGSPQRQRKGA